MGDVYCHEVNLSWENPHRVTRETVCHRDPIFTVDVLPDMLAVRPKGAVLVRS